MTLAFNLVPQACRLASRRAARLRLWVAILLLAGLGVVLLHLHGQRRRWMLAQTRRQLQQITSEQQELDRQLNMVARTRKTLLERARAVLEVYQGWPVLAQLSRLYTSIPTGIALTQVSGERIKPHRPNRTVRNTRQNTTRTPKSPPAVPPPDQLRFELQGYADNFAALSDLIAVLEDLHGWKSVRLLRAGRETVEGRSIVRFAIEARIDPLAAEPHDADQVANAAGGRTP